MGFKSEDIKDAVAVALVHLDTDADNQELWFQMTRADVKNVIEKLTTTMKRMDAAEKLFSKSDTR